MTTKLGLLAFSSIVQIILQHLYTYGIAGVSSPQSVTLLNISVHQSATVLESFAPFIWATNRSCPTAQADDYIEPLDSITHTIPIRTNLQVILGGRSSPYQIKALGKEI